MRWWKRSSRTIPATSRSTIQSRAACRRSATTCCPGAHAHRLHDVLSARLALEGAGGERRGMREPRRISAGRNATSVHVRSSATCSRARSPPTWALRDSSCCARLLTEASASNVRGEERRGRGAAARTNLILLGITYDLLVLLAAEGTVKLEVRPIPEAELRSRPDEVWLTSSTRRCSRSRSSTASPWATASRGRSFRRLHALSRAQGAPAQPGRRRLRFGACGSIL